MDIQGTRKARIYASMETKMNESLHQMIKIAKEDPRRVIHSLKVGLALTIVSVFYYLQPFYKNFGDSSIWAVVTVVVIFEYSVGATLGKGVNKGLATLVAGGLGIGAHHLATLTGKTGEPLLSALFVFIHAVTSTFMRFLPQVKARYDFGMQMFIVTFCIISISGYRTDDVLMMAQKRLCTILVGASTCLMVAIFVCPVWAGEDLQNLIAKNIDKIANSLEDCLTIPDAGGQTENNKQSVITLTSILADSKNKEEIFANFAKWEPGHGCFKYYHPWKQYIKIGNLTRECGRKVDALNSFLNSKTHEIKIQDPFQETFTSVSNEAAKALREISRAIKTMTQPSPQTSNLKTAAKNMKTLLISENQHNDLLQFAPLAGAASILIDTVSSVESIGEAVKELSELANFRQKVKRKGKNAALRVLQLMFPSFV